jgi:hypothetical protein
MSEPEFRRGDSNEERAASLLNRLRLISQGIDRPATLLKSLEADLLNIGEQSYKPEVKGQLDEIEKEIKKYEDD